MPAPFRFPWLGLLRFAQESQPRAVALHILRALKASGYEAYFVGGAVRDVLSHREPKEFDIVTSATLADIDRLMKGYGYKTFPDPEHHVNRVYDPETGVTTDVDEYRKDVASFGREQETARAGTVEEDLARRDLSINAIALDPETGQVIDPYGGQADLEKGLVRAVGDPYERFQEDYLRIIRAVRFAAAMGFEIDPQTQQAMTELAPRIPEFVSPERIHDELMKTADRRSLSKFINLADNLGILQYLGLETIQQLKGLEHGPHHPEGDPFVHTLKVLEQLEAQEGVDKTVLLAALFHDIGKRATATKDEEGVPHFYGHEDVGADIARKVLNELRFDNETISTVVDLVKNHMKFYQPISDKNLKKLYNAFGGNLDRLIQLVQADIAGGAGGEEEAFKGIPERVKQIKETPPPVASLIDGNKIMEIVGRQEAGPWIGQVKAEVMDRQYDGTITTPEQAEQYVRDNADRFKVLGVSASMLTGMEIINNV